LRSVPIDYRRWLRKGPPGSLIRIWLYVERLPRRWCTGVISPAHAGAPCAPPARMPAVVGAHRIIKPKLDLQILRFG